MARKRKSVNEAAEERLEDGPLEGWTEGQHNKHAENSAQAAGFDSVEDQIRDKDERFAIFQAEQEAKRGKGGRPKSEIELTRITMYKDVVNRAVVVATAKGISVSHYLSEIVRPIVDADFNKAVEELKP